MKKVLMSLLIVLAVCSIAYAKVTDLEVEFVMDAEFAPFIDSYKLYTEVPGSGVVAHVASFAKSTNFIEQVTAIDLDPGKITNFYLAAVYGVDSATAIEDRSDAFPYKFTGKPVIIRINKN